MGLTGCQNHGLWASFGVQAFLDTLLLVVILSMHLMFGNIMFNECIYYNLLAIKIFLRAHCSFALKVPKAHSNGMNVSIMQNALGHQTKMYWKGTSSESMSGSQQRKKHPTGIYGIQFFCIKKDLYCLISN